MNLIKINNFENYSIDLNTNIVYNTKFNRIMSIGNRGRYNYVKLYKNGKRKLISLHRLIYEAHNGTIPENMVIDHIDNNSYNNNIKNLRLCSISENVMNRSITYNKSTGIKNISFIKKHNSYRVCIKKKNCKEYQKEFKTLEEAIEHKKIKLKELHGEYANFD